MRILHFVLLGVLFALVVWFLWIISKPGRYRLTGSMQEEQLDAMLSADSVGGNHITIFTDGVPLRDAVVADMQNVSSSIHLQFFKLEDDVSGRHLASLMAEKVAAGAETRVLYDDFMCYRWRSFYRRMRATGVQTAGFNPVHWPIPTKRDYYRNHRKCIVLDGKVAYLGGYNLADRYVHGLEWGRWRDTMIRIEGPAVAQVQRMFLADWSFATGCLPSLPRLFPRLVPVGQMPIRVVASGPIGDGPTLLDAYCRLLDDAQQYVWFESPYFIPPSSLLDSIIKAAERGVDVRVLQPPRGDNGETTQWASRRYYAEAMRSGVKIGVYAPGFLHSKIIVSDDRVGVVGSCNIDYRSLLLCEEVAAVVTDTEFACQLRDVFLADESESHYIDPAEWNQRPIGHRLAEVSAGIIAKLL